MGNMGKFLKRIGVPVLILGGGLGTMFVASFVTGVPVFQEFRERSQRVVERVLPVESIAVRSRKSLDNKLRSTNLTLGSEVFVRIYKQEAELELWLRDGEKFSLLHSYPICKHSGFLGPKLKEGDKQAPEGFYAVTKKQLNPGSRHYRAFNLGFPNEYDRAHGRTGSALMVHGGCTSIGCYAMTDLGVGEIYRVMEKALNSGQKKVPVHVFPFRMTKANMAKAPAGKWVPFWENIKAGHDLFEANGVPPKVGVCNKRYAFGTAANNCRAIAGWS